MTRPFSNVGPHRLFRPTTVTGALVVALVAALLAPFVGAQDPAPAEGDEVGRELVPGQISDPHEVLERYPPLIASLRIPVLEDNGLYPCSDCHDNETQLANPRIRVLEAMHDEIELQHGAGRFWCLTCHAEEKRDHLVSLEGDPISYDEAFLLCGQCHFQRQRDFFQGAHGKRLDSWQGPRKVANCTECHDAHRPAILPAAPYAPPEVRRGLERQPSVHHLPDLPWTSHGEGAEAELGDASHEPEGEGEGS